MPGRSRPKFQTVSLPRSLALRALGLQVDDAGRLVGLAPRFQLASQLRNDFPHARRCGPAERLRKRLVNDVRATRVGGDVLFVHPFVHLTRSRALSSSFRQRLSFLTIADRT